MSIPMGPAIKKIKELEDLVVELNKRIAKDNDSLICKQALIEELKTEIKVQRGVVAALKDIVIDINKETY